MYLTRLKGYKDMGFDVLVNNGYISTFYTSSNYEEALVNDLNEAQNVVFIVKKDNEAKLNFLISACKNTIPLIKKETRLSANMIIINERHIWYVAINPFVFGNKDKDIMRIDDVELAKTLICLKKDTI